MFGSRKSASRQQAAGGALRQQPALGRQGYRVVVCGWLCFED
jgi:hypothetical protein